MKKIIVIILAVFIITPPSAFSEKVSRSNDYKGALPVKVARVIKLPEGYHEGLYFDGEYIWVNNGENIKTWVVDLSSGSVAREIEPVGTFTEGLTVDTSGNYWVSDWDAKKLFRIKIEGGKMLEDESFSFAPSRPAGVVWADPYLYMITWTRGALGTRYHLYRINTSGEMIKKYRIKRIHEPSQLAWDGRYLWISSWYSKRVYRVDPETFVIDAHFVSPVSDTTGIVWDGSHMWLTGTDSDLYQLEIGETE